MHEGVARAADLAAIRKLHQADIDATSMTQDLNALTREAYEKFKKELPGIPSIEIRERNETGPNRGWLGD